MYDANRLQMGNGWHQRFFGNLNASMLHKSTLKKSLPCFFPIIGQGELRCPNDCSLEPSQKMRKDDRLLFIDTRFSAFFMLDNPLVLPITKRSMQLIARFQLGLLSLSPFPSDGDVDGDRCGWRLDRSG